MRRDEPKHSLWLWFGTRFFEAWMSWGLRIGLERRLSWWNISWINLGRVTNERFCVIKFAWLQSYPRKWLIVWAWQRWSQTWGIFSEHWVSFRFRLHKFLYLGFNKCFLSQIISFWSKTQSIQFHMALTIFTLCLSW